MVEGTGGRPSWLAELGRDARVVVLTGAGISADSGIPTFRGPEGYWTVGAREYHPREMATLAAFGAMPAEVWRWYLYRRGVCRGAQPNAAHRGLVRLAAALPGRMEIVTQNVDGLHLRAGSDRGHCHEVHGNIDFLRCTRRCDGTLHPLDPELVLPDRDTPLPSGWMERLCCPRCDAPGRPHVLWFDEYYEEELFRSETALGAAARCTLLIVVGCSGAASLPHSATVAAVRAGARLVNVDPEDNPFARAARSLGEHRGVWLQGTSGERLPGLCDALASTAGDSGIGTGPA